MRRRLPAPAVPRKGDLAPTRRDEAPPDWLEKAGAGLPLGRLLEPAEVARAVAFLLSAESMPMTGALVDFDQSVQGAGDPPRPTVRLEP